MPVQRVQFTSFANSFVENTFYTLADRLELLSGNYTIGGPFFAGEQQIDGVIISQTCLFTLTYKAIQGRIERGANTPTRAYDWNGRTIDLGDRHEDPFVQTANQWQPVRDLFRDAFGVEDICIKSALVFDSGSAFNVPADNRDFTNAYARAFILNLDEVVELVQTFQPPRCRYLDKAAQAALVAAIVEGAKRVTPAQKRAVTSSRIFTPVVVDTAVSAVPAGAALDQMRSASFPGTDLVPESEDAPSPQSETLTAPAVEPERETAVPGLSWPRIVPQVALLVLAFGAFSVWGEPLVATLLTLLVYGAVQAGGRWLAGYTFVGGMVFTVARAVWLLGLLGATATAVFWPIGAPLVYFADEMAPLVEEAVEEMQERVEESAPVDAETEQENEASQPAVRETAVAPTNGAETPAARVEIIGNSNVRAGPGTDFDVVGVVEAGETYVILDENEAGTWFQIRLEDDRAGWIGSSRVTEVTP